MKILLTGAAGFIGYHVFKALLEEGTSKVVGIDNLNSYYNKKLKTDRLEDLGFSSEKIIESNQDRLVQGSTFQKIDISDEKALKDLFEKENFDVVCNLAAQAGVRYSIDKPKDYIESNIDGFFNILEMCRHYDVDHLVYASSSSVYGKNQKIPFSETDNVDHPISLYAATKKSNELMAYTYSHLYDFKSTGLRFFTVYGPWGRPDMAYWLFTEAIDQDKPIDVYNHGQMQRDFTYIDDVVSAVVDLIFSKEKSQEKSTVYNIGNNHPESLEKFIGIIEKYLGKEAEKNYVEMQPGDVPITYADIDKIQKAIPYKPSTNLEEGLEKFVDWYKSYHYA